MRLFRNSQGRNPMRIQRIIPRASGLVLVLWLVASSLSAQVPIKKGCRAGSQTISVLCSGIVGGYACTGGGDCDSCENAPVWTGAKKVCATVSVPPYHCAAAGPCSSCGDLYTGGECMEVEPGVWQCLFGTDAGVTCGEVCDECS